MKSSLILYVIGDWSSKDYTTFIIYSVGLDAGPDGRDTNIINEIKSLHSRISQSNRETERNYGLELQGAKCSSLPGGKTDKAKATGLCNRGSGGGFLVHKGLF